ncbi:antibiotic biosynthesis monooxygenase family protein [Kineococcus sp. SYSU DK002]|uniref:antibiotic biosynthesis monooxygenase family protein n=1 Tax=Kineococcus sp. SYSU DK002 TaxID=3383123 RepID=UPI003D7D1893
MVIRIWRTAVDEASAAEYERFAREVSLPMFARHAGHLGVLMGRRGDRCIVITCWRSPADVEALEASGDYRDVVARIVAAGFAAPEQSTETFEAHLSELGGLIGFGGLRA